MLIKLRARTTQPLVIIIFAEFYDDFFFFWLVFYRQTINSLPPGKVEVPGVGSEDACWLPVWCVLSQPEPWR